MRGESTTRGLEIIRVSTLLNASYSMRGYITSQRIPMEAERKSIQKSYLVTGLVEFTVNYLYRFWRGLLMKVIRIKHRWQALVRGELTRGRGRFRRMDGLQ